MCRLKVLFSLTVLLLAVRPATAATFAVGSCKPKSPSFTTISAAVSSVPPGSTILVCPGIYPEQVTISQSVNLQGITDSNQNLAAITVPATGLVANAVSVFGESIAAQVLVQSAGPVNINDISVDGSGGDLGCAGNTWLAGIFYVPGSTGQVNHAKVSNQVDGGCGVGIWAESSDSSNTFLNISNNSVHDADGFGIFAVSGGSAATLYPSIRGNVVSLATGVIGIGLDNVTGSVKGNDVSNAMFGIVNAAGHLSMADNTVSLTNAGIALEGGGFVSDNTVSNSSVGVFFFSDGGVVRENRIANTTVSAIEFNCSAAIVSENTVNDAVVGLDNAPLTFRGRNNFNNTAMINGGGCAAVAAVRSSAPTASVSAPAKRMGGSIREWRTPASPNGSLK